MLEVTRIYEGLRKEGLGIGVPMTFVEMGFGEDYPKVDSLVGQIVKNARTRWICITGEDTIRVGMGTLVTGLVKCDLRVEVTYSGLDRDPSWLLNTDRWIVEYLPRSSFNYKGLRSSDMVKFIPKSEDSRSPDLKRASEFLEALRGFVGTKYFLVSQELREDKPFIRELFELIVPEERVRIYWDAQ